MAFPIMPVLGAVSAVVPSVVSAIKERVSPSRPDQLGKETFLKLLVEQIRHQNPLNPLDNTQFISQTATFSSLEELQNIRKTLESLTTGAGPSALAAGTPYLGQPILATAGGFTYAGTSVTLPFVLDQPVAQAAAEIITAAGAVVARLPLGSRVTGAHTVDLTPGGAGGVLPAGQYRYRIVSLDRTGAPTVLPAVAGTVTGVRLDGGVPVLALGPLRVNLSDVAAVGAAAN